ncbi:polyisoprenoid-binding protein YceI [Dyadobacter jejuensis]|uniref:Polyisoprenoid-binding protein YceI n=1 Tax=Dyadobacter jejuensis TaxID=1082580 RepID=A0A316APR6_9BACT|nr:YceI family protein [Dyadobacter jejuensis]PWJ58830.1 polyisoprenoid-binding protein YceI [Dyadobacter jejuensis]
MKTIKTQLAAFALALFVSSGVMADKVVKEVKFKVNATKSELKWHAKKVTGEHFGTIGIKEGVLTMDGTKLVAGKFVADLTNMVCTDLKDADYNAKLIGHLKSDDFFSVEKHPTATFVLTKATPKGKNEFNVTGDLTIKGITKPVTFPVTVTPSPTGATAKGTLVVDRSKYDIKYNSKSFFDNLGDKMIYDDFTIEVNLVATK